MAWGTTVIVHGPAMAVVLKNTSWEKTDHSDSKVLSPTMPVSMPTPM